jgi:hypothetical protein
MKQRRKGMKKSIWLCVLILGVSVSFAAASCIGPIVTANAGAGAPGFKVTLAGRYFTDGCHDVCINGVCPPTYPAKAIKILFVQGDKTQEIARVDANEKFELNAVATIPANATAGAASIVAETLYEGHLIKTRPIPFTVLDAR